MKSRKKSTPSPKSSSPIPRSLPPGWDETAGLRETFLYHFTQPEDATALRRLVWMLLEYALEHARFWPDPEETPVRLQVAAMARDLRYLQGFAQQIAREPKLSSLSPVDEALAKYVGKQAAELARLAEVLERALG